MSSQLFGAPLFSPILHSKRCVELDALVDIACVGVGDDIGCAKTGRGQVTSAISHMLGQYSLVRQKNCPPIEIAAQPGSPCAKDEALVCCC
jgi:hypothetical protein